MVLPRVDRSSPYQIELDSERKKQVKKEFKASWEAAKKELSKGYGKLSLDTKKSSKFEPVEYSLEQNENEDDYDD